ncbi:MAG: HAD-IC family P-type ATPase, partial [Thioalkalispiraceae bacterium]
IGNIDFIREHTDVLPEQIRDVGVEVILATRDAVLATFRFEDALRAASRQTIAELHQLGIKTLILSGDRQHNVDSIARDLEISNAVGLLSPQQKLQKIDELQASGAVVAMVGDGINDAPVLSKAQVSIAMGQGTQIAQASADMILLSNDLGHLVDSIRMSKHMQSIIKQNLGWALLYNVIAVPLAAAGWVAPWMAAIGMSMSSLIVVMNALRLGKAQSDEVQVTNRDARQHELDQEAISG